jgi:hypothetical protein
MTIEKEVSDINKRGREVNGKKYLRFRTLLANRRAIGGMHNFIVKEHHASNS